jgi:hypothetical protein
MRTTTCLAVVLAGVLGWGAGAAAQTSDRVLVLSFDADGRVNLRAQNVTPREILAEWGRLCQCHLVNAEGLRGEAVTVPLLFEHQPQTVVLGSLLRQAAGYVLTPRRAGATGPSAYETIYIVATSNPSTTGYSAASAPMPAPAPISTRGSPENEIPPVPQIMGQPAATVPPPGQQPAINKPATPGTGLPTSSVFVPIIAVPSSPFATTPNRGGGPGTPTAPPAGAPGPAPAPQQPGTVGANP